MLEPATNPLLPETPVTDSPPPATPQPDAVAPVQDNQRAEVEADCSDRTLFFKTLLSSFLTILLAELGDKTQLTTLLMAAETQSPWIIFTGAAIALILTSLLGVLAGQWLANRIAPQTLERAAGILLLAVSALLFWEVFHPSFGIAIPTQTQQ